MLLYRAVKITSEIRNRLENDDIISKINIIQSLIDSFYIKRKCDDTGKFGIYFSSYLLQSLCMSLEYESDMIMFICEINEEFDMSYGKYSFRYINKERYIDCKGRLILNVIPTESENINHFDLTLPIIDGKCIENDFISNKVTKEFEKYTYDDKYSDKINMFKFIPKSCKIIKKNNDFDSIDNNINLNKVNSELFFTNNDDIKNIKIIQISLIKFTDMNKLTLNANNMPHHHTYNNYLQINKII